MKRSTRPYHYSMLALVFSMMILIVLLLAFQGSALAQGADPPRYVAPGGSDTANDCTDSLTPCATVQHAIDQALPGDTIYVAAGTYVSGGAGQVVNVDKTVTLLGGYTPADWTTADPGANPTILDGGGTAQVVTIVPGTSAVIQGFHIRNGTAANGGGVYIAGGTPALRRNRIYGNGASQRGGGIYVAGGTPLLANNLIYGNNASTQQGGGLFVAGGEPKLYHNTIYGNQASDRGGGVYISAGTPIISATLIISNTAANGGGIYGGGGVPVMDYNDVWGNTGGNYGGSLSVGGHSTSTNPIFVDAPTADFHLQASSPIIDLVPVTQTLPTDFAGWGRPLGPGSDIGAYEFYTGTCFARIAAGQIYTSVQEVVTIATAGDTIKIAGVCTGSGTNVVNLTTALYLQGGYTHTNWIGADPAVNASVLDGEGARRVVNISGAAATLDGLHIRNGNVADHGAGIRVQNAAAVILNNRIYDNQVTGSNTYGAGIYLEGSDALVEYNQVYSNTVSSTSGRGGGIYVATQGPQIEHNAIHHNDSIWIGGGFAAGGGTAVLQDNQIYNNTAVQGAGAAFLGGWGALQDSQIFNNTAASQGGGIFTQSASPTIAGNQIYGNQTTDRGSENFGGAGVYIYHYPNSTILRDNEIYNNTAAVTGSGFANRGGGVHIYVWSGSNPLIERNSIHDNATSGWGGGIYVRATLTTVRNNLLYDNSAGERGGGLALRDASTVENNTIYNNSATTYGGGIYVSNGTHTLRNSIITNNTSASGGGIYGTVTALYSDVWNNSVGNYAGGASAGTGSFSSNPLYVNAGNADFRLQSGSPCIENADPNNYPADDYDGYIRPFDLLPDIGAHEYYGGTCFARVGDSQVYADPQDAVDAANPGDVVKVAGTCQGTNTIMVGGQPYVQTVYISQSLTLQGGYTLTNWVEPSAVTTLDAQDGGRVIYITGTQPVHVEGFMLTGGSASTGGGLYLATPQDAILQNLIFYDNAATTGAGLASTGGNPSLLNDTFAYNTATGNGGGIYLAAGAPVISNTIVASNTASSGGGLYAAGGANPALAYNDFWQNTGGDYAGTSAGSTDVAANPRFVDAAGGDLHLAYNSPCIHLAAPNTTLTIDWEGDARPLGRAADVGADEADTFLDIALAPDRRGNVLPGEQIIYAHYLTNTGTITDSYDLTHTMVISGPGTWGVSYPSGFSLAPGEAAVVPVTIDVPVDAISNSTAIVILTATSHINPFLYDVVSNTTVVNWYPGVALAPEYDVFVNPGTVITFAHTLTNTGNATDTFRITLQTDQGWVRGLQPTLVKVSPRTSTEIWLILEIDATTPAGLTETAWITATSIVPDSGVSDAVTDRFEVAHTPGDRFVATYGSDISNNCLVIEHPCRTVQYAVEQAVTGDTIKVAEGTYFEHDISINNDVILQGGYRNDGTWTKLDPDTWITTIDAQQLGRVMSLVGNPRIQGLWLINGATSGSGGGVYVSVGSPTLRDNVISSNQAVRNGGGIYNALGNPTVERNHIRDNQAGIAGGGFYNAGGTPNVWNNVFRQNTAATDGGGAYVLQNSPPLWHNTFYGNSANRGAGIFIQGGSSVISNTIFVENVASVGGAAVYRGGGTPTLDYLDIWHNQGGNLGGGVTAGPNSFSQDPQFVNIAANNFHLLVTSPCVDRGGATPLTTDIDGQPRPVGLAPDVGADEYMRAGVILEPDHQGAGEPEDAVGYLHVLTNTGSYTDTFTFSALSSEGWAVELPPPTTLGKDLSTTVWVTIHIPADAISGTVDTTVITATSGLNPDEFDTAIDTTTVVLTPGLIFEPDHVGAFLSNPTSSRSVGYPHSLENTGNYTDSFSLSWTSDAGLPVVVSPNPAQVGPGTSITVWVTVTIPPLESDVLLVDTTHVTATSQFDPAVQDAVTDTTFVNRTTGVLFTPDRAGSGHPGDLILYTHYLTNTGNYTDSFDMKQSSWGTILGPKEVTLSAGEGTTIQTRVSIPGDAISSTVNTSVYTATSQFNPTVYDAAAFSGQVYDTVTDTTVVEQVVGVELQPSEEAERGLCVVAPGQAPYEYTVHNSGNYTDTFDITAQSEHGWVINIYFTPVTLGPDEERDVLVILQVPNVAGQFTDHLVVTATSRTDDTVWDRHETDTSVNWDVGLELEPDRSSWVILETSVTYTHVLTNTGADPNTYLLTYKSSQGWPVTISPSTVENLAPGNSALISVTVNVPAGIISATDTTIVTATATLYCEAKASVEDVTIVGRPDLILEPNNEGIAPPGTPITYTHYLTNTGGITDTYSLSVVNDLGWPVSALPPTVGNLPPGGVAEVRVVVNVPLGTEAGTVSVSEVKATSSYAAYIYDTAVDTTTVPYVPSALIEPDCVRQADPGATVVCTHTLANTGNFTETFFFTTRGEFAQATVQPKTIGPLSPGQSYAGSITVTIQIPDNAASGQTEETELIATFAGAEGQSVQVDTTYINYVQGTRYVAPAPHGLNDNNNCLVLEYGPCATVQQAADQALPGDLIKVATGTYNNLRTIAGHKQVLFLEESLVVRGGYANNDWALSAPYTRPTTLDALGQGRVIYVAGEGITPTLEGLRLTGGAMAGGGGGGLYAGVGAEPTVRLSAIFSNTATSGGGIYYAGGGKPLLERNTFYDNQATDGGAFYLAGGAPRLQNNLVYANQAIGNGGALFGEGSNARLRNNTLFDNRAGGLGGGIFVATGSPVISHTIVASSTNYGVYNSTGAPILAYNTVWGSSGGDYSPGLLPGPGSFSADPRFAAPESYDLHLSGASPCVDAGQPGAGKPPDDYEGNPRPLGPLYDIGAYEYTLTAGKAGPATADPGGVITYTITVVNSGFSDQTGIVVTDTLHSYLDYAGGLAYSAGTGQYLPASRTISWLGDVPAGDTVHITFTARITDWLAAGTVVSNVAYVDLGPTNPATTTINAQPGTRHVAPAGDDTDNNCLLSTRPCVTVQYAVDQALDDDAVKVAGGTYTDTLGSGCVVSIDKTTSLTGGFAPGRWSERDPKANPTTLDAQGSTHGVCVSGSHDVSVTGFRIANASGRGIDAADATLSLNGNEILNNDVGVRIQNSSQFALVNNIVADNAGDGLWTNASSGQLVHNTLAQNGGNGATIGGSAVFTNNIVYSHTVGLAVSGGSSADLLNTLWYGNAANATGTIVSATNIYADPAFVAGYRLSGNSPAMDAGLWAGVDEDVDRDRRPSGVAPDVGADQYPLRVTRWADPNPAAPCGVTTHTIQLDNLRRTTLNGVQVQELLPATATFAGLLQYSNGSGSHAGGVISWAGYVAPATPTTIVYTAQLDPYLISGMTMTHTATITDPISSFQDQGTVVTVAQQDASLTKTGPTEATIGQVVTYTLTFVVPSGHTAYQPVVVDQLPLDGGQPALVYVPGSANPPAAAVSGDGSILTWTVNSLSAPCGSPQVVNLTFAARVQNLPGNIRGQVLANTAAVSYTEEAAGLAHMVASQHNLTLLEPVPAVQKWFQPADNLGILDPVTITIQVRNNGDSPLYDVVVTDTLPAGLDFVSATPGEDARNGQTITWTLPGLPPGMPVLYTVVAQVQAGLAPGTELLNQAGVQGSSQPGTVPEERAYAATAYATATIGYADLSMVKESSEPIRSPGQQVAYTLTFANQGAIQAEGVVVTDTLPLGLTGVISRTSLPASVQRLGRLVTWTLDDALDRGQSGTIWITGTVSLSAQDGNVLHNVAGIRTTTPEIELADNVDWADVTVRMPSLSISKVANPTPVYSGELLTYTLTVQNTGLGDATDLTISDQVPADTAYVTCSGGDACGESGSAVTWDLALLPPGGTTQVILTVRVDSDLATGAQIINTNYGVTSLQGSTAQGQALAVDVVRSGHSFFLPLVVRKYGTGTAQQLPPPPDPAPTDEPTAIPTATPTNEATPPAEETPEPGPSGQEAAGFTVYLPVVVR